MKYIEANFTLQVAPDLFEVGCDLLAAVAGEAGFESFEETADGLKGYVQAALFQQSALDEALADIGLPGLSVTYTIAEAEDRDWNEEWETVGFDPVVIDNQIVILDAGRGVQNEPDGMLPVYIRARQAFGTGTHQTTRMMLSLLLRQMATTAGTVLDCGCGTGILAIAASLLGASAVTAYDVDEWSVENARHNARLNGAELSVLHGDAAVLSTLTQRFSVVMANINRNILLNDLPVFAAHLAEGGTLLLSGFYESDASMILDKAARLGLHEVERLTEDDWCCLALR